MGNFVGDILGGAVDTVGNVVGEVGNFGQKVFDNPIPAITAYATGNPAALLSYAAPTGTAAGRQASGNLFQGGLNIAGQMQQNKVSQEAIQAAQRQALAGGQTASNMAAFRPVGTTTNFGTSSYQFDPTTGQLTSAGYNLSPQLQAAQNTLMGGLGTNLQDTSRIQAMGRQYMAQSPQEQAAQYMANQQALLAPSREQQSANLMNQLSNTGRTGLSVAQGGNLGMANPEYQALANARAMQDLQLAANATQAGQQQYQFGQGLLSSAYDPYKAGLSTASATEQLGQQPFGLSTDLAKLQASAGGMQGQLYGQGAQRAAGYGILPELQTSNTATILGGLSSPTSQLGSAFSGLFGGLVPSWTTGSDVIPMSTFGGYGDIGDLAQYGVF
jgi:hypothetical protein